KAPKKIDKHYVKKGCSHCHFTGYKGRQAIYEIIPINETLRQKIKTEDLNVRQLLKEEGIQSLADNAFTLFEQGLTSIDEIYAILASA
ncbi:MAG: type II/IV secretion system protein, partial [Saprospiraceae bacterium]|nr:type II/IV secretion system protein [Saprospiraceae bacterium]